MSRPLGATQDSAAFCADLVRSHDFVRYISTLFLPPGQRRRLLALYAFNVEISRVRSQVSQALAGEVRLQWWSDALAGTAHGGIEGNPVAAELLLAIRDGGLPTEPLARLIEAHQFDLYNDPMPTMAALEAYSSDTLSALFWLGAQMVIGQPEQVEHLARHAGLAQGLAQVMTALPFDASRRQLFLPLQWLESEGNTAEDVFAGKSTPKLRATLDRIGAEAQRHLSSAWTLLETTAPEIKPLFLPLAMVRRDLQRMSRADHDPFVPHAPSRLRSLWTLWRASRSRPFRT